MKFTPSRLALARQRRGLSLVQLAQTIGVTAQSLSNAERGRQDLSEQLLESIGHALDFPVDFLRAGDIEELHDVQVSFRARSKTPARAKAAARSSARLAVELQCWIEERFVAPAVVVPTLENRMSPELAAEHVRTRWGLNLTQPIANCIHLFESKGVAIFSLPPETQDVDAFSFWWRDKPFIMLSTTKSGERSRFDAAHELGHLVLHKDGEYGRNWRAAEHEANQFASAFLMPRDSIYEAFLSRSVTTERIIRTKLRWRVAALALAYRLRDLGLLSEWLYRQVVIELGRQGYRGGEPNGMVRESSQLLAKVLSALRSERFTLQHIARELRINVDELRALTFGLVVRAAGDPDQSAPPAGQSGSLGYGLRVVGGD